MTNRRYIRVSISEEYLQYPIVKLQYRFIASIFNNVSIVADLFPGFAETSRAFREKDSLNSITPDYASSASSFFRRVLVVGFASIIIAIIILFPL